MVESALILIVPFCRLKVVTAKPLVLFTLTVPPPMICAKGVVIVDEMFTVPLFKIKVLVVKAAVVTFKVPPFETVSVLAMSCATVPLIPSVPPKTL